MFQIHHYILFQYKFIILFYFTYTTIGIFGMQNKNQREKERQSSQKPHQNINNGMQPNPPNSQVGIIVSSPSKLNFQKNQLQNTISKSVNDGANMVPFVGNGLNIVSIAEKVAQPVSQKSQQQQINSSLNQKQLAGVQGQLPSQKQSLQLQQSQLLSRASQNNQKFVANFGRRAMVPLQPGIVVSSANGSAQNIVMIGSGLNSGSELQFVQLQQQSQMASQQRESSVQHQLQSNNIFLDQNFNNFVSLHQQAQKGQSDSFTGNQLTNQNQASSGTSSFRIPSQDKNIQQNDRNVSSSGIALRQHYQQTQAKQIYLPFIQTPKQHHASIHTNQGKVHQTINGKQQASEEPSNLSIFKDIQSQKMSIAHNGQHLGPVTGVSASAQQASQNNATLQASQKFPPSQKYDRVKQFDQAMSHGFTPQTTQTSQNSVKTALTSTNKSQNNGKNASGQGRSESTDYYLNNQQHKPNLIYIGIDSEQNVGGSLSNMDQLTNSTFNDMPGNLLGSGKSPFVKQYAMTEKKKKMSFSQQGPYRVVGIVQQPMFAANQNDQLMNQNSIFNSKKNIVSIAGEPFVLQSNEYQQQKHKDLSQQSRSIQAQQTIIQTAIVRLDNNAPSNVNFHQINTRNGQQMRENHANNTQQLQSANLTKLITNGQQLKVINGQQSVAIQNLQFACPQKTTKNQQPSQYSSSNRPTTRGTSASKLIKPMQIETKGFNSQNKDYSPNSAQLPLHSETVLRQTNGAEVSDQNAMQMFYGDYQCDGDEPEEDDQSNQDMDGSQFSDDIDDRVDDDELDEGDGDSVEADSPTQPAVPDDKNNNKTDRSKGARALARKKSSLRMKESLDPNQRMTDNQELMEEMANKMNADIEMGTDQMKFLDMLQQSKLKKNGSMKPLRLNGKSGGVRAKRQKNKSQNQSRVKVNQRLTEINEGDESNDEGLPYHSDTQSKQGNVKEEDSEDENLKELILKIETPKITSDMTKKEIYLKRPPNNKIVLNYGPIPGRAPSVFFNYPPFLKMQRPFKPDKIQILTQEQLQPYSYLSFRISGQTHTYNCVVNALKTAGFHLVNRGMGPTSWNIIWAPLIRPSKLRNMNPYQKINHFAGAWGLGSKANLWRNVQKQRRKHGKEFEICPITYVFPEDYKRWVNDREMNNYKDMYIFKPTSASCGKGIKVIGKKDTVPKRAGYLVSKYISKPHLLRGYKYDLRIYILVTCFEPLKAYIFKEGLVRLATQPYTTNKNSLKKRFVHLTNYSVNKKADNYAKNKKTDATQIVKQQSNTTTSGQSTEPMSKPEEEEEEMESKWSLKMLREEYEREGIDYADVYSKIKDVCIKTLMSVEPYIVSQNRTAKSKSSCFEVYGFDVLIDQSLKPWLLEVNVLPSLSSSSPFDKQVKSMLLSDTFHLLGFNIFDRKQILESKALEKKNKLLGPKNVAQHSYNQNLSQASQIYKSQKLRTQASIQDSPYKVMDMQSGNPNNITATDNTTASTGLSAGSGASASINTGLPQTKQKQRYMMSPAKVKKSDAELQFGSSNYKMSRPQMLNLGLSSDYQEKSSLLISPEKVKHQASPEKFKVKDKVAIPSFLQGFEYLTEDDLEILAVYEEEQARRQQTQFERLFPTKDTIETLGKHFDCQRHANNLIWQYIRQKCPNQPLRAYFKSNPQI